MLSGLDVSALIDTMIFDYVAAGNIQSEVATGPDGNKRIDYSDLPYDPILNNTRYATAMGAAALEGYGDKFKPAGQDFEDGSTRAGFQPAMIFRPTLPKDDKESNAILPEWSLSPLRIAFHNLKVPMIGPVSVVIEKTKKLAVVVYSLVYMALPTLAWFLGVDKSKFKIVDYNLWRPDPPGYERYERCKTCGGWNSLDLVPNSPEFKKNPFIRCPHLIREYAQSFVQKALELPDDWYVTNYCRYMDRPGLIRALNITELCDHSDTLDHVLPNKTPDGLYACPPMTEYRGGQHNDGLRCSQHFQEQIHGWHPQLYDIVFKNFKAAPAPFVIQITRMLIEWAEFTARYDEGDHIWLMGLSLDRVPFHQPYEHPIVVLYNEDELPTKLLASLPESNRVYYSFFRVPVFSAYQRFLADVRVLMLYFCNAPIRITAVNQKFLYSEMVYINHLAKSPYRSVSGTGGHTVPAYMGTLTVSGRAGVGDYIRSLCSLYWGSCVYGWDENYPHVFQQHVCAVYKALARPAIVLDTTFPRTSTGETALMITAETEHQTKVHLVKWSRESIYWVDKMSGSDIDPGRLSFWHVWSDPRPIMRQGVDAPGSDAFIDRQWLTILKSTDMMPEPRRVVAPGDHIIQELAASLGGISFFTIGTRGDILPFEALARHIASYGVPVMLYILNDSEEGKILLQSALGKRGDNEALKIFNRARTTMLEQVTGASIVHSALMTGDVPTADLTPPPDLITARTVAGTWLMAIGSAILGVWYAPSARIGPYTGPRVLPTSHNGKDFLKLKQNRGRIPIGAVWGSDENAPPGYEKIPLVPNGDHLEIFRDYVTIVCHGGAGTVATAAAAGCRVQVPVGGLDRTRRQPFEAGLGMVPGADPDNVWLVLADQDIRFLAVWLRRNLWKPWKLFRFYGFQGVGWALFRLIMLYTLYNSSFKKVPVSSEPIAVLIGVLGGRVQTWLAFSILIGTSKAVDALLDYLNISYMRLLTSFFDYNFRMATSPVALFIASRYNIGFGLLYSALSPWMYRFLTHTGQAWYNWILGSMAHARPDGEHIDPVYLEFSIAWQYVIPVVHTALVNPTTGERFEGVTQSHLYVLKVEKGEKRPWSFWLPTTINWAHIKDLPEYAGRYSLAWNCQTAIVVAAKRRYVSLGPGGIFLYITSTGAAIIYTINAAAATVLWSLIALIPPTIEPNTVRPGAIDIAGDVISSLWNKLSVTGEWDPIAVLAWWRTLLLPI